MSSRLLTILGFVLIGLVALVLEVRGRREGSQAPTALQALRQAMRWRLVQVAVLLGWWWLGWHFFK